MQESPARAGKIICRMGGTEDVGNAGDRKLKWLDVVRRLYQKAWNSDRNELMIAWAKNHLE